MFLKTKKLHTLLIVSGTKYFNKYKNKQKIQAKLYTINKKSGGNANFSRTDRTHELQ
jgi:hypothetical protein